LDETEEFGTIQYGVNAWLKRRGDGKVSEDQVFIKRSDDSFFAAPCLGQGVSEVYLAAV
jgi:hypothetical protein